MTTAAIAAYKSLHRLPFTKLVWGIANQIGVLEALLLEVIENWCQNNATAGKRKYYHNDEWWTAATYQEWSDMYPCLGNPRKLQRLLLKIENEGYLISGQFLSGQWNQTKFYRPNPETVGQLILNAAQSSVTSRNQIVPKMDALKNESVHSEDNRPSISETVEHPLTEPSSIKNRSEIRSNNQITPPTPSKGKERERQFGFEVPESEEESSTHILAKEHKPKVKTTQVTTVSGENKFSALPQKLVATEAFGQPRRRIDSIKGKESSVASDPWMDSASNPNPVFAQWLYNRHKSRPTGGEWATLANACSEIRNDYMRAGDLWQEFLAEAQDRFEKLQVRLASGGTLREGELKEFKAIADYADQTLVEEVLQKVANHTVSLPAASKPAHKAMPSTRPKGAEAAPETYQSWEIKEEVAHMSPEECAANIAELNRRMAQAFNRKMPTPKPEDKPKPKSFPDDATLEQLQELLRDRGISLDTTFQGQLNKWLASHEDVV